METSPRSRLLVECETLATAGGAPLDGLAATVREAVLRLEQPLRLAVAGQIKRGKSTLVNALLGEDIAATGQLELTFTVNEFRHAEQPVVTVHYKNGGKEGFPPEKLHELTARNSEHTERLRTIRKVEYGLPNELLRSFRLVDTPGLGSVHGLDSANTMDALGITGFTSESELSEINATLGAMGRTAEQIHGDSAAELDRADAILYLFSRAMHERDHATVESFVGPSAVSMAPLKAFGVLSRCDQYWPPSEELPGAPDPMTYDPIAVGAKLAEEYLERPETRRLFFTVVPVAGLVGIGAQNLTDEEFNWLDDLAKAEPVLLADRLGDAAWFATRADLTGIALPPEQRAVLVGRLGAWGIHLACGYLRNRLGSDEIRARLLADSGVTRLRGLITGHFGNRSALIKLDHGLAGVAAEVARCRLAAQRQGVRPPDQVAEVAARIEKVRNREHGFAELGVLSDHYNDQLSLTPEEVAELLSVTGEYGTTAAARLGRPDSTPPGELEAVAEERIGSWARREQDPMLDRRTAKAAYVVRRSYERIAHRIRLARRLLETDTDIDVEEG